MTELLKGPPQDSRLQTKGVTREQVLGFEKALSRLPGVQFGDSDNCPLKHSFGDGIYVREIFIPKGTLLVGKIHRHSHPNFLLKGHVTVITEDGGIERLKAPLSMISPAATKRIVYAHEGTVWVTVHVTEEHDIDAIEEEVIAKSYEELDSVKAIDITNISRLLDIVKMESEV